MPKIKFIDPYEAHGEKSQKVKKITVSVPTRVLKLLIDERTRRQINNLRHATLSDLLCEAFLHAYTGQDLPTDDDLSKTNPRNVKKKTRRKKK